MNVHLYFTLCNCDMAKRIFFLLQDEKNQELGTLFCLKMVRHAYFYPCALLILVLLIYLLVFFKIIKVKLKPCFWMCVLQIWLIQRSGAVNEYILKHWSLLCAVVLHSNFPRYPCYLLASSICKVCSRSILYLCRVLWLICIHWYQWI